MLTAKGKEKQDSLDSFFVQKRVGRKQEEKKFPFNKIKNRSSLNWKYGFLAAVVPSHQTHSVEYSAAASVVKKMGLIKFQTWWTRLYYHVFIKMFSVVFIR